MSKDDKDRPSEFDDVFQHVSSFGRYQRILYFGSCFLALFMAFPFGVLVFGMGTPQFHCDMANTTCRPNKCCDNCTSYIFDGPFTSTASEWNLVCDRAYLNAVIQSCMFGGMLIGAVVSGMLSDAYGRKVCIFVFNGILTLSGFGSSFADRVSLFALAWFILGFGVTGVILSQYIYIMEIVGPKFRTMAGNISWLYWSLGYFIMVMLAYFVREWRILIMITTIPGVILFVFWRVFPESPRWLVAHNHLDEAHALLMKYGGKTNRPINAQELRELIENVRKNQIEREQTAKKYTPLDLVRTPKLRKWSLALGFNWFAVSFLSNALYLYVTNLSGDIYLNFAIMQVISTAQQPVIWILIQKFGRRLPHCCLMILTGTLCLLVLAVPERFSMVRSGLFLTVSGISMAMWTTIYIITSEIYPTVVRNTAQGTGSTTGRIGAIAAPYVAMLGRLPGIGITAPVVIFGVLSLLAGAVSLWILETLFANMHQTIEETEEAKDDYGIPCCRRFIRKAEYKKAERAVHLVEENYNKASV